MNTLLRIDRWLADHIPGIARLDRWILTSPTIDRIADKLNGIS